MIKRWLIKIFGKKKTEIEKWEELKKGLPKGNKPKKLIDTYADSRYWS